MLETDGLYRQEGREDMDGKEENGMKKDLVRAFYDKSTGFCKYVQERVLSRNDIDILLSMLMGLYTSALVLPDIDAEAEDESSVKQQNRLYIRFSEDFPVTYLEIYNPLKDDTAVGGELFDDLYDILSDLQEGIEQYDKGNISDAVFAWKFGLRHHWGTHAVDAIKALHWIQNV